MAHEYRFAEPSLELPAPGHRRPAVSRLMRFLLRHRALNPALLVILAALHLGVRIYNLGAPSFWWDESFSWYAARFPDKVIGVLAQDVHPPAYFFLLGAWKDVFGESEFALRFPSVIYSALTLLALWAFSKRLSDGRRLPLIIVSVLTLFSPYEMHLARFARNYTMLIFLCLAAAYFLFRALLDGDKKGYFPGVICALLAMFTHYMGLVAVAATLLAAALERPRWPRLRSALAVGLVLAVAYLPWIPTLVAQLENKRGMAHFHGPLDTSPAAFLALISPAPAGVVFSAIPAHGPLYLAGLVIAAALVVVFIAGAHATSRHPWGRALLLQAAAILLLMALSPTPLFNDRNICILLTPLLLLLTHGLTLPRPRALAVAAAALVAAFVGVSCGAFPHTNAFPAWREGLRHAAQLGLLTDRSLLLTVPVWDFTTVPYYAAQRVLPEAAARRWFILTGPISTERFTGIFNERQDLDRVVLISEGTLLLTSGLHPTSNGPFELKQRVVSSLFLYEMNRLPSPSSHRAATSGPHRLASQRAASRPQDQSDIGSLVELQRLGKL